MDIARLAELRSLLKDLALPVPKRELLRWVLVQGVNAELLVLLAAMPDREYRSIDEVAETLRGRA